MVNVGGTVLPDDEEGQFRVGRPNGCDLPIHSSKTMRIEG
jgi:hypothetical protein